MPLPSIIDIAHEHFSTDVDKMREAGLPEVTIRHLLRIRDIYAYWVAFPNLKDRQIVAELRNRYGIGDTVARADLRVIKTLMGDIERLSTDYVRYRVTMMLSHAYEMAERSGNTRDMIAAARELKDVHRLTRDDDHGDVLASLARLDLHFTDDPTVLGLPRIPNVREKARALKEKYWTEDVVDVEPENIEEHLDDIFKPDVDPYANPDAASISQ